VSFVQRYEGWSSYASDVYQEPYRLFVAVPCIPGEWLIPWEGMLDTGAEWCVLPADLASLLGGDVVVDAVRLETRLGTFEGRLERLPVQFPAIEGEALRVEATWFVSEDWPGPLVLGWKGCLERFRFALDSREERFYFGEW
jgi:hypothetical protein